MDKLFVIFYQYSDGHKGLYDKALVRAESQEEAKEKLQEYIKSLKAGYMITYMCFRGEFKDSVFSTTMS